MPFHHAPVWAAGDVVARAAQQRAQQAKEPGRAPRRGGGLGHVRADLQTPYGPAFVSLRRDGDTLTVEAQVPPNTAADVELPGGEATFTAGSGRDTWTTVLRSETMRAR